MAASHLSRLARRRFASLTRSFVESLEKRTLLSETLFSPDVVIPNEGESYSLYAAETPEGLNVVIDWGDGSTPDSFTTTGASMGRSHIYADNGTYYGVVTIETAWSTFDEYFDAVITNEAPYATPSRSFSDTTGLFTVGLSNILDVSADASSVRYSFSDDYESLAQSYSAASTTASAQIDFVGGGEISSQEIYCRVWDKDDGYRDYTTVLNVADLGVATASATQTNLTWTDSVTGETGWRVQRSIDGTNFSIYENLPPNTTHFEDTAATEGTRYWYRVRAYGTQGTANDIGYSPKKATTTRLASPTDILANISESTGDMHVSWTNQSAYQDDIILTWVQPYTGGGLGISPSDSVTLPGDAQDYTFPDMGVNSSYYVHLQVINDDENSSANSVSEHSQVEPTNDWTTVYDLDTQPFPSPSYVDFEWSPGDTREEGMIDISIPKTTGYDNETVTLTVSNLPRHTWGQIAIVIEATGADEDSTIDAVVDDSLPLRSNSGPETWNMGINSDYATGQDAFRHTDGAMTIEFDASGFPTGAKWYVTLATVRTYLPHITLTGGGMAIEDGSGDGKFTASRNDPQSRSILGTGLAVSTRDAGGTASGFDYQTPAEIEIPASELSEHFAPSVINDKEAEGVEQAKRIVKPRAHYAPVPQALPALVAIDDDVAVHTIKVTPFADENFPAFNWFHAYNVPFVINVFGEHLDKVQIRQWVKATTTMTDFLGNEMTPFQINQYFEQNQPSDTPYMPALINSDAFQMDWDFQNLPVIINTNQGTGEQGDLHSFAVQKHQVNGYPTKFYCNLVTNSRDMLIETRNEETGEILKSKDWSLNWTNNASAWEAGDTPMPPYFHCAISYKPSIGDTGHFFSTNPDMTAFN